MQLQLCTKRLLLKPLTPKTAPDFVALIGDKLVADTAVNIPHPYTEDDATAFFNLAQQGCTEGHLYSFAVSCHDIFIGEVSLKLAAPNSTIAELGYWIGVPHWGNG